MNYNFISQLVSKGFEGDDILPLLLKNAPHMAKKIKSLIAGGWGSNEVLEALQQDPQMKNVSLKNAKPSTPEEIAALKVYQGNRSPDRSRDKQALGQLQNFTKKAVQTGMGIGSTALGAYALKRALPQATQAIGGMLPNAPGGSPLPQTNPTAQGMRQPQPMQQQPIATPQTQAQASTIPQAPNSTPPSLPLPQKLQDLVSGMLAGPKNKGKSFDEIGYALKKISPQDVKAYEKTTGQPIAKAVEDFAQTINQEVEQPQAGSAVSAQEQETPLPVDQSVEQIPEPVKAEAPKKEKGSTVALPNGEIGEITDIRQGIATVNANGKEFRRKLDELIEPPMEQKDLADLYNELLRNVEAKTGEELSRMANLVGYDEDQKALFFQPVGATAPLYVYTKLNDAEIKELKETQALRKGNGGNYVGAYTAGTKSPYGSKLSSFISKLQKARGGKGNEYEYKFDKLYDALEPAKIASHEKHVEEKKASKPIKEKENDKKRKAKKPRSS